ncbi:MAG TPA: dienelactone hydrolase family protein [Candidatus Binataceae bacterium]|nr:dienelactone hydrolase family protein [Candidatus Binataceae bacterium]
MAQLETKEIHYAGKAGQIRAYTAHQAGDATRPAVIVVQEWWGLNDNIKNIARRFADEGYFAIAPDLYSRQGNKVATDPNTAAQLMTGLKKPDGIEDLKTTIQWLRSQPATRASKIGVTGYCMGGSYALLLPCESDQISAAAPFYGEIPSEAELKKLNCPIFYAYGENDGWIQRKDVDHLAHALKNLGKKGEVKIYKGCQHGFFNETRKDVYAPDAAKDAWQHTLRLFSENLK